MNYAFRVTESYDNLSKFVDDLAGVSEKLAVYEHSEPDKRTHIHGYVEGVTVSTDTLKNWIKKALNVKAFPKSDWEFATKISKGTKAGQVVDQDSLVYFHKGKYPLKFNKGFTEEFIKEQHSKSYTPTEYVGKSVKTQYKLVCENSSQKKIRENDLIKLMIDKAKVHKQWALNRDTAIIESIKDVLVETKTICGVYKAVDYYDTICAREWSGTWFNQFANILEKRKPRL